MDSIAKTCDTQDSSPATKRVQTGKITLVSRLSPCVSISFSGLALSHFLFAWGTMDRTWSMLTEDYTKEPTTSLDSVLGFLYIKAFALISRVICSHCRMNWHFLLLRAKVLCLNMVYTAMGLLLGFEEFKVGTLITEV